jgi:putative hemolysin
MTSLLIVVGIALALSFLCSLLEAVLLSTPYSYIADLEEEGDPTGVRLARMRENPDDAITSLLTLNTIAHTLGGAVAGARAFQIWGDARVALFCVGLTFAVMVLAEIVPKTIGLHQWRSLAPTAAQLLSLTIWLMRPFAKSLGLIDRLIGSRGAEAQRVSRAEFEAMVEIERRQGGIDEDEWEVVANVMNLDQVTVNEVMTPRISMVALSIEATVAEAMDMILEEGHLRMPVYRESVDRIVGVLLARDLWKADREGIREIRDVIRPATFVPSSKRVEDLLRQMREQRIKMAIVLDEFGGTAGLVTLEDLVEEIIGEIQDEHEQEPLPFEEAIEGEVRVRGEVPLWEVNERFDLDLPEDVYDTVGGFVFGQLERIPDVGDEVETTGGRFRVVAMDGRRVTRVAFIAGTAGNDGMAAAREE